MMMQFCHKTVIGLDGSIGTRTSFRSLLEAFEALKAPAIATAPVMPVPATRQTVVL